MLEEYEMLKEDLHTTSFKNVSHAIVKFAFRRRIEDHVTNTFTQVYWSFCRVFQLLRQSGNHFKFAAAMRQICGKISHPNLRSNLATILA